MAPRGAFAAIRRPLVKCEAGRARGGARARTFWSSGGLVGLVKRSPARSVLAHPRRRARTPNVLFGGGRGPRWAPQAVWCGSDGASRPRTIVRARQRARERASAEGSFWQYGHHSHTFWQYGHHAWLSLYKVTRTGALGCPKVRTSACECVGPVAWSGGTYDAANGASSDQLSAARLARLAAFDSSIISVTLLGNVPCAVLGERNVNPTGPRKPGPRHHTSPQGTKGGC